jgi:hypothetical protein
VTDEAGMGVVNEESEESLVEEAEAAMDMGFDDSVSMELDETVESSD